MQDLVATYTSHFPNHRSPMKSDALALHLYQYRSE